MVRVLATPDERITRREVLGDEYLLHAAGGPDKRANPLGHPAEVGPARDVPCLPGVVGAEDDGAFNALRAVEGEGKAVHLQGK